MPAIGGKESHRFIVAFGGSGQTRGSPTAVEADQRAAEFEIDLRDQIRPGRLLERSLEVSGAGIGRAGENRTVGGGPEPADDRRIGGGFAGQRVYGDSLGVGVLSCEGLGRPAGAAASVPRVEARCRPSSGQSGE